MAQEIDDLIAKIRQEGVEKAQEEAAQIKSEAEKEASRLISEARSEAEKIVAEAKVDTERMEESTRAALKQSGRDLLIGLRQEINAMLERLVRADLKQVMTGAELAGIISALVKNTPLSSGSQVVVSLSPQDKEKLEKEFLKQLVEETKKGITLSSAEGMESGFTISFDGGKSVFDFSGQALGDFLSGSLRPELKKILDGE
ncbi:MAG: V-type ATP synthase subunit E family protein [Candidatus Omnitrophica bacterium]|nr:V-type ATP synthase subunit E family protein [Candidatus Omnitrophota bacterium]